MKTLHLSTTTIFMLVLQLATAQSGITLSTFATGFESPTVITHAMDNRLFVAGQTGTIQVVESNGNVLAQPFLDITDRVKAGGEQGLLGLAFAPDYVQSGYFYVNYTGAGDSTHISRFKRSETDKNKADAASEKKIMTIYQPYKNHNGGALAFGPDGYLYIGLGDGGSGGDPENRAQDLHQLLGKILRIDVSNPLIAYSIPATNPFSGDNNARQEIWDLGLRNPWRISFDRKTGDLWIADVGQDKMEEINLEPGGSHGGFNYGWRCYEGSLPYKGDNCPPDNTLTFPVSTYTHSEGCAITGGYVFRGDSTIFFYGNYFFADFCSNNIWMLKHEGNSWVRHDVGNFGVIGISTFGEDSRGTLYAGGQTTGSIYKVLPITTGLPGDINSAGTEISQDMQNRLVVVKLKGNPTGTSEFMLYDTQGRVYAQTTFSRDTYEFNVSGLNPGIYIVRVRTEKNIASEKIFVGR